MTERPPTYTCSTLFARRTVSVALTTASNVRRGGGIAQFLREGSEVEADGQRLFRWQTARAHRGANDRADPFLSPTPPTGLLHLRTMSHRGLRMAPGGMKMSVFKDSANANASPRRMLPPVAHLYHEPPVQSLERLVPVLLLSFVRSILSLPPP